MCVLSIFGFSQLKWIDNKNKKSYRNSADKSLNSIYKMNWEIGKLPLEYALLEVF